MSMLCYIRCTAGNSILNTLKLYFYSKPFRYIATSAERRLCHLRAAQPVGDACSLGLPPAPHGVHFPTSCPGLSVGSHGMDAKVLGAIQH